jgi:hypothetical protein
MAGETSKHYDVAFGKKQEKIDEYNKTRQSKKRATKY